MPQSYHVKLSDGREFNVTTEGGPPSEADVLSGLTTAGHIDAPQGGQRGVVSPDEPSTYAGGFLKGLKDFGNEFAGGALNAMAHPGLQQPAGDTVEGRYETKPGVAGAADFASLAIPGGAGKAGVGQKVTRVGVGDKIAATGRLMTAAGTKASGAPAVALGALGDATSRAVLGNDAGAVAAAVPYAARATGNVLERIGNRIVRGGPEPQPLHAVEGTLPQTPAPQRGQLRMAPIKSEPVAQPLAVQMQQPGYFPETPAPQTVRGPEPPMRSMPQPEAPPAQPPASSAASTGLSDAERAQIFRKYPGLDPAKVEQAMGQAPTAAAPAPMPESPLRAPRIQTGAERVGRAEGLSKEQVRQQTGPVLDEQPGEASPILPRNALGAIVDKLKTLPMADREAYVQAATSGKAKWQIENIRRTLEHLGLLIPAAVGGAAVRDAVMQRLGGFNQPQGEQ